MAIPSGRLYMVCAHFAQQGRFAQHVIRLVIVVALFQAALATVQAGIVGSIGDKSHGLLGLGGANALGFLITLAVVLVAASDKPLSRSVWLVIVGTLGIVSAQSRAAIITLPFALMLAYRDRLKRPLLALAIVAILVASGYVVAVAFERSQMSVSRDLSPEVLVANQLESPDRGGGRLIPLLQLPGQFGASPLAWMAGLGPGQYGSAYRQIPSMLRYAYSVANSEWTVIWGEYGLIGLACPRGHLDSTTAYLHAAQGR